MEEPKSIIWSPETESDLEGILHYLEKSWTEKIIQEFLNELFRVLDWIAANPQVFMQPGEDSRLRKFVLSKHHTLYFEVFESHINLLRIFDTRQDPVKSPS